MRTAPESRRLDRGATDNPKACGNGFSLIELLISMSIMAIALLSIASMFATGYTDVTAGGKTTMATAAARQILEDIQTIPFANLPNLNNTGTNSTADLPAANPERDLVRKWRYALAGDSVTWGFTTAEKAKWSALTVSGVSLGATGRITVVDQDVPPTLRLVTVTVSVPGRPNVQLATLISRL
ncbi:MAG TPA: type II secretion system protein [Candidatus Methylomirabilis sp.]|nr:type II secretion system protein [Candidatus Methylomirabilis sp.]